MQKRHILYTVMNRGLARPVILEFELERGFNRFDYNHDKFQSLEKVSSTVCTNKSLAVHVSSSGANWSN
jgi:hypothetical protein